MTIEELDILVEASIEPALKEIKKLIPQIKQNVEQAVNIAQKSMGKIDMQGVSNKVQKAVQVVKNKIDNLKKSSKSDEIAIKVNNTEASKQLTQLEKEIDSLEKKISSRQMRLNVLYNAKENFENKALQEAQSKLPEGIKIANPDAVISNAKLDSTEYKAIATEGLKIENELEQMNKELEEANNKAKGLRQELNQAGSGQGKLATFFSGLKEKIGQAKVSLSGFKGTFKQLPNVTQNITNNIGKMTTKLKSGLTHILKYAGALLGLRAIYSVLRNSASAWLSSQNAGAQQLSANIEYMKYALGSMFAPVIEYIVNLIYQLMKALQSVIYAFSGINIFAKATAKSMKTAGGSAKEASKALAGVHSEISNVSDKNSGRRRRWSISKYGVIRNGEYT